MQLDQYSTLALQNAYISEQERNKHREQTRSISWYGPNQRLEFREMNRNLVSVCPESQWFWHAFPEPTMKGRWQKDD
jgi:hypothetical protein